jgi:hypothetical protein
MNRLCLAALSALALAGCIVVPVASDNSPPPPPPRVVNVPPPEAAPLVWYHGPHAIPEEEGGGWCYEEGAHTHSYFPDRPDAYVVDRGYYTYDGPTIFVYVGGHPLPGGGWCFIEGNHTHDYYPPARAGFSWRHGHGFYYEGPYRPQRPPPPTFWPHPARWHRVPPPAQLPTRPAPVYRPPRGAPPPPPPRVVPTPAPDRSDDHDRGRFEDRDRKDDRGRVEDRDHKDDRGRVEDRDRKDDRGRLDDRDRKIERGHLDEDPAPPTTPRGEQKLQRGKTIEQPKGATTVIPDKTVTPDKKDRFERAPVRHPAEAVDRRKDEGKSVKDKVKSDQGDDAKDDAAVRPGRGRH